MKRTNILFAAMLLSMASLFTACGNPEPTVTLEPPVVEEAADTQPPEEIPFDAGTIANGRYTNTWADISLPIPEGMTLLSQEEIFSRFKSVSHLMTGKDLEAQQEAHTHMEEAFVPLFMLEDTEVPGSLKVLLVVEYAPDIHSPQEYLERTLEQLAQSGEKIEFDKEPKEVQLGGQTYFHAALVLEDGSGINYDVRQMKDGSFLVLSIGYGTDLELNQVAASFIGNISYACPYTAQ